MQIVHPKYNFFTYEYDLALVKLERRIDFQENIIPICLPGNEDLLVGKTYKDRVQYFSNFAKIPFKSHSTNMATFVVLRHPVTNLVTDSTNPNICTVYKTELNI